MSKRNEHNNHLTELSVPVAIDTLVGYVTASLMARLRFTLRQLCPVGVAESTAISPKT